MYRSITASCRATPEVAIIPVAISLWVGEVISGLPKMQIAHHQAHIFVPFRVFILSVPDVNEVYSDKINDQQVDLLKASLGMLTSEPKFLGQQHPAQPAAAAASTSEASLHMQGTGQLAESSCTKAAVWQA